jgi:hypothetical protein
MHNPEHEELCLLFDSGELDSRRRAEFERTLSVCAECRVFLESLRACGRLCRGAVLTPGPELDARALEGTPAAGAGVPRPQLLSPWTVTGLSASLVLAGALVVFLARPAAPPGDLAWTSGLDEKVAAVGEELEDVSRSVKGTEGGDIDDDLEALESAAQQMREG